MFALSQRMYLFEANLDFLTGTLTPNIEQHQLGQNLTTSCLCCRSTGLTERKIHNTIQLWGCIHQRAWRAKSAIIAVTGGTTCLRFYQKMSGQEYTLFFYKNILLKKTLWPLFYVWGSTASRLEPFPGGSLLFTTKFPDIPGTYFTDLELTLDFTELTLEPPSGFSLILNKKLRTS